MPKCLICDSDMEEWSDEPCEECQTVINDTIEDARILDPTSDDLFVVLPITPKPEDFDE